MAHPTPEHWEEAHRLLADSMGGLLASLKTLGPSHDGALERDILAAAGAVVGPLLALRDELFAANTAEVERRRAAEAECVRLSALVADIGRERLALVEKLRSADFAAEVYCGERDAVEEKRSAERRKREAVEALAERLWPYVEAAAKVGAVCGHPDQVPGYGNVHMIAVFTVAQCRAAAALVREREETKP